MPLPAAVLEGEPGNDPLPGSHGVCRGPRPSGHGSSISQVSVPGTGKLVATAKGLSKGTGKIAKAGTVTVTVTLDPVRVLLGLNLGTVLSQNRHIHVYYVTFVAVACGSWSEPLRSLPWISRLHRCGRRSRARASFARRPPLCLRPLRSPCPWRRHQRSSDVPRSLSPLRSSAGMLWPAWPNSADVLKDGRLARASYRG